jgi:two-component system sensor histidine kinase KdpD
MPALDISRRYPFATRIVAGTLADALLALVCYRLDLNLATTSLLFLLAVVGQSLGGGARSSILASFLAAGFLDYFFVPPVLTWRISDPFDFFALLVFVSTSLVITSLASRARREAQTAERRRTSLEHLYRASQALISMPADGDVIETLVKTFRQTLDLRAVCLFDGDDAETYLAGESEQLVERTRNAYLSGLDGDDRKNGISTRCLRRAGRVAFAIGFDGLSAPELTAGPLVTLTIATLERARASQAASRATAETRAEAFRAAVLDGLAHEFKTPLAIIVTAAGGIREAGPLGVQQMELADAIEQEASRLGDLTTRLLRKAEVDADHIKPRL